MTVAIEYDMEAIARIVGGRLKPSDKAAQPKYLSVDSRKIVAPESTLFWAIRTEQRDGSLFMPELYSRGVRNFITEDKKISRSLKGVNVILVKNSLLALHKLATYHRKRFKKIKVIGVTGSNGKTIVKDWLFALLSPYYDVVRSPRSFNSQIGVPLSILQIRSHHVIGIFEAGISKPGEMKALERMIQPRIGIFTNIGTAHDEGFRNRDEKIREKLLLFSRSETLVYPEEENEITENIREADIAHKVKVHSWGTHKSHYAIKSITTAGTHTEISIATGRKKDVITIPFTDKGSIQNAINCFGAIKELGIGSRDMIKGFGKLQALSMRLELQYGINGCVIINDSYSNDLQSLEIALDFLLRQQPEKHTVILSDMLQSGRSSDSLYKEIAGLIQRKGVRKFVGVGLEVSASKGFFNGIPERYFFRDTESMLSQSAQLQFENEVILIKGARKFRFEDISRRLEKQSHETIFSINLTNLAHNVRVYKSFLKPDTRLMAMVKAFAYGAGSSEVSSLLQFIKADYLTVAYADEGVALREAGISLPVMVMNVSVHYFDALVKYRLEPEIFSPALLLAFTSYLKERKLKNFPVHIKIDTGMHRLGFDVSRIDELLSLLKGNHFIRVQSVFSHLSASDNPEYDSFTMQQYQLFRKVVRRVQSVVRYPFLRHIANTSAISRFAALRMDMVRLGIGLYGIDSNPKVASQLMPVCKLTTTISQIKNVKKGEVVGYGRNVITRDKVIATVGIGYADGYRRVLGNGVASMFVRGRLVPTVGNICMDMTMIDISGIEGVREGDEVEVFGENLPIERVALWAHTIPYEILTGISQRVKRVYYEE